MSADPRIWHIVTGEYPPDLGGVSDIDLGSFAAGEARTYKFTVTLDQAAGNADQGKSATADYEWTAVQS